MFVKTINIIYLVNVIICFIINKLYNLIILQKDLLIFYIWVQFKIKIKFVNHYYF